MTDTAFSMGPEDLGRFVAAEAGVTWACVLGPRTDQAATRPRHLVMLALSDLLNLPGAHIGRLIGRDHTTVIYGMRRARQRLAEGYGDLILASARQRLHTAKEAEFQAMCQPYAKTMGMAA